MNITIQPEFSITDVLLALKDQPALIVGVVAVVALWAVVKVVTHKRD